MPTPSASSTAPQSPGTNTSTFKRNQEQYYSDKLGRKWDCSIVGHTVCVPTLDGRHRKLSEEDVSIWVQALCAGEANTAQPPDNIMNYSFRTAPTSRHSSWASRGAVSIPPSRSRSYGPCNTTASSGVPGVGLIAGRGLKWLGMKGLGVIEDAMIVKRWNHNRSELKRWQGQDCTSSWSEKQAALFPILEDALELSRECYSETFNKAAFLIGSDIQRWLSKLSEIPSTKETAAFIGLVKICLLPLILSRISKSDPHAGDLAWDVAESLSRVPLQFFDERVTSDAICIIIRELTYSTQTHQHSWLGIDLRCIIGSTLQARQLTPNELAAIHEMEIRRSEGSVFRGFEFCRPWEVTIFAECAAQDPLFRRSVLSERGFKYVIATVQLTEQDGMTWEKLSVLLRSLAFLSEYVWVANMIEDGHISLLLNIFRRNTPKKWFSVRFWAIDTIFNVVSHRPSMIEILILSKARRDLVFLMSAQMPGRSTPSLEDYQKEAYERAKRLLEMMETWDVIQARDSIDTIVTAKIITTLQASSDLPDSPPELEPEPRRYSAATIVVMEDGPKSDSSIPRLQSPTPPESASTEATPKQYLSLNLEFPWVVDDIFLPLDSHDTELT